MTSPAPIVSERSETRSLVIFRDRRLPIPARLAGYSALIERYELRVPLHHNMAAVSAKNVRRKEDGWTIYPASSMPGETAVEHLVFALKYEGIQLLTLKKLFAVFDKAELAAAARSRPASAYLRRLCYLYEWLTAKHLDLSDAINGAYVDLLDKRQQIAAQTSRNDKRFRIRDNLPGTVAFCPIVFRTHRLESALAADYSAQAKKIVESTPKALLARAAAFLLLSDSKASFAIEGEDPPGDRIARWGAVVGRAGQMKLDTAMLIRLQRDLIGDSRFVPLGLRQEGGFVGRHDAMAQPVPEHISANPTGLKPLLDGIAAFNSRARDVNFDAVLTAACVAFGFVYVHPFEDGNGRLHRFLMHHVLAERNYTPPGIVFPISSVILGMIPRYKDVLETVSMPLLEWIDWRPTDKGNVKVIDDTDDYYRYFDATAHCEFLFRCIETAVEIDLPDELCFLEQRDLFHRRVTNIVDMGERRLDLLLAFARQSHCKLSKRALTKEFALLTALKGAGRRRRLRRYLSQCRSGQNGRPVRTVT